MDPTVEQLDVVSFDGIGESGELLQDRMEVPGAISIRSILAMTCGMGGIQVVWSTIFSNGTIYLITLGLPDVLTALVWATPAISGCFIQPLIGASSDSCTHPWGRRKPYIAMGAFGVSVSIISLAWAGVTGHWAAALFFPAERIEAAGTITRICAVLSICMLGLAVQPLQCGLRALVLDLCPAEQQVRAQAWAVRFSGMGQILGCAAGVLGVPSTSSLGGLWTFRILSVVAILAVNITAIVTCLGVQEPSRLRLHHRQRSHHSPLHDILRSLIRTFIEASPLIRRVLSVQILAWMGWFTFLFYNTSHINTLYTNTTTVPDGRLSGYLASLVSLTFSCVAFTASAMLPPLVNSYRRSKSSSIIRRSSDEPDTPTLLTLWSSSLALSAVLMFLTLISTSFDVTIVLVTLNGIPWAISNWIPFAVIGKLTAGSKRFPGCEDPGIRANAESHSGGALIGLHNIAISAPQILAAGISSGILWLAKLGGSPYGAGWVLWAGGFAHLAAASIAFRFAVQSQRLIREG